MDIAIHGSHDSSICFVDKCHIIRIYEIERFCKQRFAALSLNHRYMVSGPTLDEYIDILNTIKSNILSTDIDTCYYNQLFDVDFDVIRSTLNIKNFIKTGHHMGHARCAFHQSNFKESLIFSFDGGGHDENDCISFFNIYIGQSQNITKIKTVDINFGTPYALLGIPIQEIKHSDNIITYSGKLMGLSAYGTIRSDWIYHIRNYYNHSDLKLLEKNLGINLSENSVSGQNSYDLARTSQYVFETLFFNEFVDIYKQFNLPVCLTGGCALNVLNNNKIKNYVGEKNIYIPPNPNDSGLSFGYFLENNINYRQPNHNTTFNGVELQNSHIIDTLNTVTLDLNIILKSLTMGNIIGVVKSNSECGPRALGNRSIICYPAYESLKHKLNSTIKFREWFRPFAAIIRQQDVYKYFLELNESKHMTYCPKLDPKYINELSSICHVDNTCRVQTITKDDDLFMYNLLTLMHDNNLHPILLNTSFNIKGRPLVNDVNDIIDIFNSHPIDIVVLNDKMLYKQL
jgi:carbamoyltransferase